eukprot:c10037_g1_i1.p1 GENE.c10037_g1_i1~~c10037_g1_i1.p1  ORF type:complete len:360 (+),score=180.26 c10037_g1_i1:28-1080(+)
MIAPSSVIKTVEETKTAQSSTTTATSTKPALIKRDSDEFIRADIDHLLSSDTPKLIELLSKHLGNRFERFILPFQDQGIDGRCFQLLTDDHLLEMAPDSAIGDRLYLLSFKQRAIKAARMAKRSRVVLQGTVTVDPPGSEADFILSEGSLKLIFSRTQIVPITEAGATKKETKRKITFCDHIDLDTIEDADLESATIKEQVYETIKIPYKVRSCCSSRVEYEIDKRATGEVKEVGIGKIYIRLKDAAMIGSPPGGQIEDPSKAKLVKEESSIAQQEEEEKNKSNKKNKGKEENKNVVSAATTVANSKPVANSGVKQLYLTTKTYQQGEVLHKALMDLLDESREVVTVQAQ